MSFLVILYSFIIIKNTEVCKNERKELKEKLSMPIKLDL